jgi:hypothetical protein
MERCEVLICISLFSLLKSSLTWDRVGLHLVVYSCTSKQSKHSNVQAYIGWNSVNADKWFRVILLWFIDWCELHVVRSAYNWRGYPKHCFSEEFIPRYWDVFLNTSRLFLGRTTEQIAPWRIGARVVLSCGVKEGARQFRSITTDGNMMIALGFERRSWQF